MADIDRYLHYPTLRWPTSGWWFTMCSGLVGLLLLAFPRVTTLSITYRVCLAIFLFLVPALCVAAWHLCVCTYIFIQRGRQYDSLHGEIDSLNQQLQSTQSTISDLLEERNNRNVYQIAHCYAYGTRVFIGVRKKRGANILPGQRVTAFDATDGTVMGHFTAYKEDGNCYICEHESGMDALWHGYVKEHGTQHSAPPPEAFVIAITTQIR